MTANCWALIESDTESAVVYQRPTPAPLTTGRRPRPLFTLLHHLDEVNLPSTSTLLERPCKQKICDVGVAGGMLLLPLTAPRAAACSVGVVP